jgi:prepilin-type N-terminal cleavage/methylation domain-containing protein
MEKPIHRLSPLSNRAGFTLTEVIIVLVIMSVLSAIAIQRILTLDSTATRKAFECAVSELNTRECLTWTLLKTSTGELIDDSRVYAAVDTDLALNTGGFPRLPAAALSVSRRMRFN